MARQGEPFMNAERRAFFKKAAFSMFGNIPFEFEDIESEADKAIRVAKEQATLNFKSSQKKAIAMQPKEETIKQRTS
ncbi:MAG: hypothetical protein H7A25_18210 [Leptospiraceae bacterium]|nr:hypothetical protein [Leptospiraceae bacterium]MCP5501842.1 hypothetical protein [Leptospiraceae bacterium]